MGQPDFFVERFEHKLVSVDAVTQKGLFGTPFLNASCKTVDFIGDIFLELVEAVFQLDGLFWSTRFMNIS